MSLVRSCGVMFRFRPSEKIQPIKKRSSVIFLSGLNTIGSG